MSKDGFDPSITTGIQRFVHHGQWGTVCYWGSVLEEYNIGDRVFFQNEYRQYWVGIIESHCFVLLYEEPLDTVIDGLTYLNAKRRMQQLHDEQDWFCDQGELPF
ncbi:hypothetical protein [Leclercia sp. GLN_9]|uniref:hypothetical protein n=1 Tax=Leclercia sp. GLN_9 TaxID=3367184 RepID=UPI00370CD30B